MLYTSIGDAHWKPEVCHGTKGGDMGLYVIGEDRQFNSRATHLVRELGTWQSDTAIVQVKHGVSKYDLGTVLRIARAGQEVIGLTTAKSSQLAYDARYHLALSYPLAHIIPSLGRVSMEFVVEQCKRFHRGDTRRVEGMLTRKIFSLPEMRRFELHRLRELRHVMNMTKHEGKTQDNETIWMTAAQEIFGDGLSQEEYACLIDYTLSSPTPEAVVAGESYDVVCIDNRTLFRRRRLSIESFNALEEVIFFQPVIAVGKGVSSGIEAALRKDGLSVPYVPECVLRNVKVGRVISSMREEMFREQYAVDFTSFSQLTYDTNE